MLTVQKHKCFGPNAGKPYFAAYIDGYAYPVANAPTKPELLTKAKDEIRDALDCRMNQAVVAVAADGAIITAREYAHGQVEVQHHRLIAGEDVYRAGGSEMGKMEIDGKRANVREYLQHRLDLYNVVA